MNPNNNQRVQNYIGSAILSCSGSIVPMEFTSRYYVRAIHMSACPDAAYRSVRALDVLVAMWEPNDNNYIELSS